jgi:chitinase
MPGAAHGRCPGFHAAALSLAIAVSASAQGSAQAKRFPVIGYFPSWTGADPAMVQWDKLTHINYSFINPTAAGGLTDVNAEILGSLITLGHKKGVKVCLAVGGWNNGSTTDWESMAQRPKSRARFVANLVELCDAYGLDGIDIDWEYPNAASAESYAVMMRELGEAMHKSGRLLSTAVVAMGDYNGAHIRPEVFASLDYLNIMAYDWNWDKPKESHSTLGMADSALAYWSKRGCPAGKLVLGLPFYGRMPETPYRDLAGRGKNAHNLDQAGSVFYNGIPTIKAKTRLAMQKAGGVMIWEVTQDTRDSTSLLGAIHAVATAPKAEAPAPAPR